MNNGNGPAPTCSTQNLTIGGDRQMLSGTLGFMIKTVLGRCKEQTTYVGVQYHFLNHDLHFTADPRMTEEQYALLEKTVTGLRPSQGSSTFATIKMTIDRNIPPWRRTALQNGLCAFMNYVNEANRRYTDLNWPSCLRGFLENRATDACQQANYNGSNLNTHLNSCPITTDDRCIHHQINRPDPYARSVTAAPGLRDVTREDCTVFRWHDEGNPVKNDSLSTDEQETQLGIAASLYEAHKTTADMWRWVGTMFNNPTAPPTGGQ